MDLDQLKDQLLSSGPVFDVTKIDIGDHPDLASYAQTCPKYVVELETIMFFPEDILSTLTERGHRHMLQWASRYMAGAVVEADGDEIASAKLCWLLNQYWPHAKCYTDSGKILGLSAMMKVEE